MTAAYGRELGSPRIISGFAARALPFGSVLVRAEKGKPVPGAHAVIRTHGGWWSADAPNPEPLAGDLEFAGSEIGRAEGAVGWTNTYEKALYWARNWHESMVNDDGLRDVELIVPTPPIEGDGRWTFHFRHLVTGVTVTLETHGIDDFDAYQRQCIFNPRVYWNGCSTSNPTLADFAAPGFEKVSTFRPAAPVGGAS